MSGTKDENNIEDTIDSADGFELEVESMQDGKAEVTQLDEAIEGESEVAQELVQGELPFEDIDDIDQIELMEDPQGGEIASIFEDNDDEAMALSAEVDERELNLEERLSLEGKVEAVIFASSKPIKAQEIAEIVLDEEDDFKLKDVESTISNLQKMYEERSGGFALVHEAGLGFQFQTVPAASYIMEKMFSSRPRPLSRAALETLSIIAYRQPSTRAEIEYIRGVDAGSIIKNLMDRNLIECVGRKEDAGRPMLFGTTPEFLKVFRINSLEDLPPLASFQPPLETAEQAQAEPTDPVDVEEFIGDESLEDSEVSEGLEMDQGLDGESSEISDVKGGTDALDLSADLPQPEKLAGESQDLSRELELGEEDAGPSSVKDLDMDDSFEVDLGSQYDSPEVQGATFDQTELDLDEDDGIIENTEVDIPVGSSLPARSGEVDSGGES